jgi:hypothetical protein
MFGISGDNPLPNEPEREVPFDDILSDVRPVTSEWIAELQTQGLLPTDISNIDSIGFISIREACAKGFPAVEETIGELADLPWQGDVEHGHVIEETDDDWEFLLKNDGLNLEGVILAVKSPAEDGEGTVWRPVAYSALYRVANEYQEPADFGQLRSDLPETYRVINERTDWTAISEYLGTVTGADTSISLENILLQYDNSVFHTEDRGGGLGTLGLYIASQHSLKCGDIRVGFIDSLGKTHLPALLSSSRAGVLIGREVEAAPDGDHPAFIALKGKGYARMFTGEALVSREDAKKDLNAFVEILRERLNDTNDLVGFNPKSGNFEIAQLLPTSQWIVKQLNALLVNDSGVPQPSLDVVAERDKEGPRNFGTRTLRLSRDEDGFSISLKYKTTTFNVHISSEGEILDATEHTQNWVSPRKARMISGHRTSGYFTNKTVSISDPERQESLVLSLVSDLGGDPN